MFVKIATNIPRRTVQKIQGPFFVLVQDVYNMDSGHLPLPPYANDYDNDGNGKTANKGKAPLNAISYHLLSVKDVSCGPKNNMSISDHHSLIRFEIILWGFDC